LLKSLELARPAKDRDSHVFGMNFVFYAATTADRTIKKSATHLADRSFPGETQP
jgi:hypothetical protein